MDWQEQLSSSLEFLYGSDEARKWEKEFRGMVRRWKSRGLPTRRWVDRRDAFLITYGDGIRREGEAPLRTLEAFWEDFCEGVFSTVHLLPIYPYTSDDGFSVSAPKEVREELGDWEDVRTLSRRADLMLDAVLNHLSISSREFRGFLAGEERYRDYFLLCDPAEDYSSVTRPRALPLLTPFPRENGTAYVWTTFSEDQADLNYRNPRVLLDVLDLLCCYAARGARFLRLDAVGFLWKEPGTSCMHLPQTHEIIRLARKVLDETAPGTALITETNVPDRENRSYFGDGEGEAQMVYQFPLPPLVLYTFLAGESGPLSRWLESLPPPPPGCAYLNFLASHDGIGMRPVEDLLSEPERGLLEDRCLAHGGLLGLRSVPGGGKKVYELNISYCDALCPPDRDDRERAARLLAAHGILLGLQGVPAVYLHSLLGTRGDLEEARASGINRRINRRKLEYGPLRERLADPDTLEGMVFRGMTRLLKLRRSQAAFDPASPQRVLRLDRRLVALLRGIRGDGQILCVTNITSGMVETALPVGGISLMDGRRLRGKAEIRPWEVLWLRVEE